MLRVTAHNSAGFTVAEYEFATLTVNGGESLSLLTSHAQFVTRGIFRFNYQLVELNLDDLKIVTFFFVCGKLILISEHKKQSPEVILTSGC